MYVKSAGFSHSYITVIKIYLTITMLLLLTIIINRLQFFLKQLIMEFKMGYLYTLDIGHWILF